MRPDGALNLAAIEAQAEHLVAAGFSGAFICGTAGEGMLLTSEERRAVAERWVEVTRGSTLQVIAHVGHASPRESQALAGHAARVGVNAIAAVAPTFYRPASLNALTKICVAIAAAAPEHPFLYYHYPALTGLDFPMPEFIAQARETIPTFAGLKFTHQNLNDYSRALTAAAGQVQVYLGWEELLLPALSIGAECAIGGALALAPKVFHGIIRDFQTHNLSQAHRRHVQVQALFAIGARNGGQAAFKALSAKLSGVNCGPSRPPLAWLTPEETRRLEREAEELDLLS